MAKTKTLYERVLNVAQMHGVGVFNKTSQMAWTCRWMEGGRESSIGYEVARAEDESMSLRIRYRVTPDGGGEGRFLDYAVPIRSSLSYKGKTWFWFTCPLTINGSNCRRRVRNLYFLPSSDYFGCKHCRDLMIRSLSPEAQRFFRRTEFVEAKRRALSDDTAAAGRSWRPPSERKACSACSCFTEGAFCCNCGAPVSDDVGEDYFEMLGVRSDAPLSQIRVAFKTRLMEYHPDRVASLGIKLRELAEAEVKQINLAYSTLKDPDLRQAHLQEVKGRKHSDRSGT